MKKKMMVVVAFALLLVVLSQNGNSALAADPVFNQKDLVTMVKPAIVKIVTSFRGTIKYPDFKLDPDTLVLSPIADSENSDDVTDDDTLAYGTGFIIDSAGYILTNSHIATEGEFKADYFAIFNDRLQDLQDTLGRSKKAADKALYKKYSAYTDNQWSDVQKAAEKVIWDNLDFSGTTQSITVLDPVVPSNDLKDQVKQGFQAKIVSVNENYLFDDKDVAVIKIDKTNLPTVTINDTRPPAEGDKILIAGFPSSADTGTSISNSTVTSGVVSSFKDSQDKSFRYLEVDAKVAPGSSGSPLIDSQGEVVGILTEQSKADEMSGGDNFAYAIPVNLASSFYTPVVKDPDIFATHFKKGLEYYNIGACADATKEFTAAKQIDKDFLYESNIDSYATSCVNQVQPNIFQKFITWFGLPSLIIGLISIILLVISVFLWLRDNLLQARLAKDEKEIETIEGYIKRRDNVSDISSNDPTPKI